MTEPCGRCGLPNHTTADHDAEDDKMRHAFKPNVDGDACLYCAKPLDHPWHAGRPEG